MISPRQLASLMQTREFFQFIDKKNRLTLCAVVIVTIIASAFEVISIGSLLPFLGALISPENIYYNPNFSLLIKIIRADSPENLLLPLTILFCTAAILAGTIRVYLLWLSNDVTARIGTIFSGAIYKHALHQPYETQISRNSSNVINNIIVESSAISSLLNATINLISSLIILIAILIALLFTSASIIFQAFFSLSLAYIIIGRYFSKKLLKNGAVISKNSSKTMKSLNEGFGGIRDILIDQTQNEYFKNFMEAEVPLRQANTKNQFYTNSPRFVMEAIGITIIAIMAYMMTLKNQEAIIGAIPTLGLLALAAQRLLPLLQLIYGSWSTILSHSASVEKSLSLLNSKSEYIDLIEKAHPMEFNQLLQLNNISFRYAANLPEIFNHANLSIPKGSRIGIVGETGCGKSTLMDLILGLLHPSEGNILVDGKTLNSHNLNSWRLNVSHVPQSIFLADSTIYENIAFGTPKENISYEKVKAAASKANISNLIESWPEQYNTVIGERGIRLSGGQKQRIGIARALYKGAKIIIFDEATSALDHDTESIVMESINSLDPDLTLIIIAHRTSTLSSCDKIYRIADKRIIEKDIPHKR